MINLSTRNKLWYILPVILVFAFAGIIKILTIFNSSTIIYANSFGTCGDAEYNYDEENHILTISGEGTLSKPKDDWNISDFNLVINEGIADVDDNCFMNCNILSVKFPSTLKNIGDYAFADNLNLNYMELPYGLITIGDYAFLNCVSLDSVVIPQSVTSVGNYAFLNCSMAVSDIIYSDENLNEDSVYISSFGTMTYSGVRDYYVPKTLNNIGSYAFGFCEIVLPVIDFDTAYKTTGDTTRFYIVPNGVNIYTDENSKIQEIMSDENNIQIYLQTASDENNRILIHTNEIHIRYDGVFTLSYNSNGGSGEMHDSKVINNHIYKYRECLFVPPQNMSFASWNIGNVNEITTVTTSMTIMAMWEKALCTISFMTQEGESVKIDKVKFNSKYLLPECPVSISQEKVFDCWKLDESDEKYYSHTLITVDGNKTFFAVWKNSDCTITFNSNGGSGSIDNIDISLGEIYTLPENTFIAPSGKMFLMWNFGNVGDKIKITRNITIKPVWANMTNTITFYSDGGTGSMNSLTKNTNESFVLPECTFTAPNGKTFSNWKVGVNSYNVGDEILVKTDLKIYAVWDNMSVNYHFNGYGNSIEDVYCVKMEYNSTNYPITNIIDKTILINFDDLTYKFKGWYTNQDFDGMIYNFDTAFKGELNLYALWSHECVVTFKNFYGDGVDKILTVPYGLLVENVGEPENLAISEELYFSAWYLDDDEWNFESPVTENILLYPRYTDTPYFELHIENNETMFNRCHSYNIYVDGIEYFVGVSIDWSLSNEKIATITPSNNGSYATFTISDDAPFGTEFDIIAHYGDREQKYTCMVSDCYPISILGIDITDKNRCDVFGNRLVSFDGDKTLTIRGGTYDNNEINIKNYVLISYIDGLVIDIEGDTEFISSGISCMTLMGNTTITGMGQLTLSGNAGIYFKNYNTDDYTLTLIDANIRVNAQNVISATDYNYAIGKDCLIIINSNVNFNVTNGVFREENLTAKVIESVANIDNYTDNLKNSMNQIINTFTTTASGHNYNKLEIISQNGRHYNRHVCSVCNNLKIEEIHITDHCLTYVSSKNSCTESGNIDYFVCEICGKYFEDIYGIVEITEDDLTSVSVGHDWGEWIVTKPATPFENGIETRYCKNDNSHFETREIEKTDLIDCQVSFDSNGGSGTMESLTASGYYILPNCKFNPPTDKVFKCWRVGGVNKYPGSTIALEEDVTIFAIWENKPFEKNINEEDLKNGVDLTEIFLKAKNNSQGITFNVGNSAITFNGDAVKQIGGNVANLSLNISKENLETTVENAKMVLDISLGGVEFNDGYVTLSIPLENEVQQGEKVIVYYVDDEGNLTDMNATVEDGKILFNTNHFSQYVIAFAIDDSVSPAGNSILAVIVLIVVVTLAGGGFFIHFYLGKNNINKLFNKLNFATASNKNTSGGLFTTIGKAPVTRQTENNSDKKVETVVEKEKTENTVEETKTEEIKPVEAVTTEEEIKPVEVVEDEKPKEENIAPVENEEKTADENVEVETTEIVVENEVTVEDEIQPKPRKKRTTKKVETTTDETNVEETEKNEEENKDGNENTEQVKPKRKRTTTKVESDSLNTVENIEENSVENQENQPQKRRSTKKVETETAIENNNLLDETTEIKNADAVLGDNAEQLQPKKRQRRSTKKVEETETKENDDNE